MKKVVLFSTYPAKLTWRVDPTWSVELTWRAGPGRVRRGTQGHVAKPREPMRYKVVQTRGMGHVSPHERPGGATSQGADRWSAHELVWDANAWEYWDSNANALRPCTIYNHRFCLLSLCGTMFLQNLSFTSDVAAQGTSDAIAMLASHGRGVHRIDDQTRAQKRH